METLRTFIAVELPEDIRKKLEKIKNVFYQEEDRISWVASKNIHLTLHFLGNISSADINSLKENILTAAKSIDKFTIDVKGVGVFPNSKNPRIIWVGVGKGAESVKKVYNKLSAGLKSINIPMEERDYIAHITLARVKYIKNIKIFVEKLDEFKENLFGNVDVYSISLIKSTLTKTGSIYETLFKAELRRL